MHRVVPELIVENYRAESYSGDFPAVGMFLDLSGFSSMTDALMTHGQHGAEVLANLMHGVFDPLVEGIFEYGGKIVGFAGDGIMALFPIEGDPKITARNALTSAWLIQQRLKHDPFRTTVYGNFQFTAKIGLTCGDVSWGILQSEDGANATYYFRGSAVDDSAKAEHHARAGEILITDSIMSLLGDDVDVESVEYFFKLNAFRFEVPDPTPTTLPPVDLDVSRIFMPEEIIAQDARGEFRQIVNLFMRFPDLSNEKLQEVTRIIFELRRKYGGLLNRIDFGDKGCNILMLWGAPVAYENDISRALNFILDLQERVDFPVTTGVTYYVAHAGYLGSVMCEDYTCYGWGVNLASRFMTNAPSGEIWVDDRIARRIASRFELDYVGEQRFKGFSALQKVHRLHRYHFIVDTTYQGEIVGREQELAELARFIEPIWEGRLAGALMVLGDAGIGKGRLVQAFRYSELFESRKALWAFCQSEQILRQSFNPFRSWLLRYFGLISVHDPTARRQALDAKLDELIASIPDTEPAREVDRLRSVLAALVDLYWAGSLYEQLDAESRYQSTLLALISLLKAESLRQPVILFVEDAQFIDADSLRFLPRLKRSIEVGEISYPIAMIVTSRIESDNRVLAGELVDQQMKLSGLSREAVARLVEILLGGVPSPRLVNLVAGRSEGNPYFVEQIIRYLQEENLIEMSASGWTPVQRMRETFLPGDIGALLVARLDQLSRKVRELVQTASVFGREFVLNVLAEMTTQGDAIEKYVNEAEQSAIWVSNREQHYIFTHGLIRDAAYMMQMRARRKELHAAAVTALEKIYADDLKFHYAELGHHSESAGLREKAQYYYTLAGVSASAAYQNSNAIEYFTRAMAVTALDDLSTQFDLLSERIVLHNRMGNIELEWNDLKALHDLAARSGDPSHVAKSLMRHSNHFFLTGRYPEAIDHAQRALSIPDAWVDNDLIFTTRICWFLGLLRLGKQSDAMQLAQATLAHARSTADRQQVGRVLTAVGLAAFEQTEPASAGDYLRESLSIAIDIHDRRLQTRALNNLAMFEIGVTGDLARAGELYLRARDLAREIGDRGMEGTAFSNLGFVAGLQGDFEAAREHLEKALLASQEMDDVYTEIFALVNLSSNACIQKQTVMALERCERAIELSQKAGEISGEAWGWLYLGHARLLMGELEPARSAFEKSLFLREQLGQSTLAMEPLAGLVETALQEDDLDRAVANAEKILAHLATGGTLNGTDEPLRVYYVCYELLQKKQDPRSSQVLQAGIELLEANIAKLKDDHAREMYVANVPWRLALRNAASKMS